MSTMAQTGTGHTQSMPQMSIPSTATAAIMSTGMTVMTPQQQTCLDGSLSDLSTIQNPLQGRIVWSGTIEWQYKTKNVQGLDTKITCSLPSHMALMQADSDLNATNWPNRLTMRLLPAANLYPLRKLLRISRNVSFNFSNGDVEALKNLHSSMSNKSFAGCVYLPNAPGCDIRVLILVYSNRKRHFLGLIPNDQSGFLNALRSLIAKNKVKQQQAAIAAQQSHTMGLAQGTNPAAVAATGPQVQPQMLSTTTTPLTSCSTALRDSQQLLQDAMNIRQLQLDQLQIQQHNAARAVFKILAPASVSASKGVPPQPQSTPGRDTAQPPQPGLVCRPATNGPLTAAVGQLPMQPGGLQQRHMAPGGVPRQPNAGNIARGQSPLNQTSPCMGMDERVLTELLECSVCLDQLDHSSKMLPCQHTFCHHCLNKILRLSAKHKLRCPECRLLVKCKVDKLPPNILLVRLLEGIKTSAIKLTVFSKITTPSSPGPVAGSSQSVQTQTADPEKRKQQFVGELGGSPAAKRPKISSPSLSNSESLEFDKFLNDFNSELPDELGSLGNANVNSADLPASGQQMPMVTADLSAQKHQQLTQLLSNSGPISVTSLNRSNPSQVSQNHMQVSSVVGLNSIANVKSPLQHGLGSPPGVASQQNKPMPPHSLNNDIMSLGSGVFPNASMSMLNMSKSLDSPGLNTTSSQMEFDKLLNDFNSELPDELGSFGNATMNSQMGNGPTAHNNALGAGNLARSISSTIASLPGTMTQTNLLGSQSPLGNTMTSTLQQQPGMGGVQQGLSSANSQLLKPADATGDLPNAQQPQLAASSAGQLPGQSPAQPGQAPTADPEKQKLIQQQLVLLSHAHKCQRREQAQPNGEVRTCQLPHCRTLKNVLNHMSTCSAGKNCVVTDCASSRQIITHWENCTHPDCPFFLPLRDGLDKQHAGGPMTQNAQNTVKNLNPAPADMRRALEGPGLTPGAQPGPLGAAAVSPQLPGALAAQGAQPVVSVAGPPGAAQPNGQPSSNIMQD